MGNCLYCGASAGLLRKVHEPCKQKHESATAEIEALVPREMGDHTILPTLLPSATTLAANGYVSASDRTAALSRGFEAAVDAALEDSLLEHDEERWLNSLVGALGLSDVLAAGHATRDKLVKALVLRDISEGQIPRRFSIDGNSPFNLQRGETLVWAFPSVPYHELKTRRSFQGSSQGMSFRIAKGVYYRVGSFKGHPVETSSIELVDTGVLGVTTKHLYFAGAVKSFRIPYSKVIAFTPYSDGIGVQRDGVTAKPQTFVAGDGWFVYNLVMSLSSFTPGVSPGPSVAGVAV